MVGGIMGFFVAPTILITKSALLTMNHLVCEYPHTETSWGIGGIVYPGVDDFALITTVIAPTNNEISRSAGLTQIGGAQMARCAVWLENQYPWKRPKEGGLLGVYADTEFVFLCKGHSHHTLGLRRQSMTDENSTMESVTIDGLDISIAPLANIVSNPDELVYTNGIDRYVGVHQHFRVQLRFYFYNKTMAFWKTPQPTLVTPTVIDDYSAPRNPIDSWHLLDPYCYEAQLTQLRNYGCTVKTINKVNQTATGLNLLIMVEHPAWSGVLTIMTDDFYPMVTPKIEILDLKKPKGTRAGHYANNARLKTVPVWVKGDTLLDIVIKHEARGWL
jgi:hypothetical protein